MIHLVLFAIITITKQQMNNGTGNTEECLLTQSAPNKPYPNLLQCYLYNSNSCCVSVHDDYIQTFVAGLFSNSCKTQYAGLVSLLCFGCHPSQFNYTDTVNKIIYLCDSYIPYLWGSPNYTSPTTVFDNCGIKGAPFAKYLNNTSAQYVIPSLAFTDLFSFITALQVPFFANYTFQIVNTTMYPGSNCFNGLSHMINFSYMMFIFIIILHIY